MSLFLCVRAWPCEKDDALVVCEREEDVERARARTREERAARRQERRRVDEEVRERDGFGLRVERWDGSHRDRLRCARTHVPKGLRLDRK